MNLLQNNMKTGQIIQINSNLAIVNINNENIACKIKGILKYNSETKPLVGDYVKVEEKNTEHIISEILPRSSHIIRPSVANIDVVILVQSVVQPDFNFHLLMKFLAYYEFFIQDVIIVFTKMDLINEKDKEKFLPYLHALKQNNYKIFCFPNDDEFESLKTLLKNKTFCLAGNSGVGKTSLTNKLFPNLNLKTQEISLFLNRGKHTTTTAKLIEHQDYKIIDTPGFSSIDINLLNKQQFATSYKNFSKLALGCKYSNCLHLNEPNCCVKDAVSKNIVPQLIYNQYVEIMKEIKK